MPLSVGGCPSLHLFCIFLLLYCPGLFRCFSLACPLPFFRFPLWGLLRVPSFFGGSPCVSPTHSPFGFCSYGLGCGPFCCAALPCASSSYCLFRPWALLSLPRSWFVSPRSPSSLFQSTLHFLSLSWGSSCGFSFRLFFGRGSLPLVFAGRSCHDQVFVESPAALLFTFVPSLWVLFRSLSFCALFVRFVYPSRFLLAVPSRPCSLFVSPHSPSRSLAQDALGFFFVILFLRLPPLPPIRLFLFPLPLPLRGPCVIPLLLGRTAFALLRLLWLFLAMLLFLPFWSRPLNVRLQCSCPFPFGLFNFPLARVSLSVLLWLRVLWFSCYDLVLLYFYNGRF